MFAFEQSRLFRIKPAITFVVLVFAYDLHWICADIMPPGHKGVSHQLVFQASEPLSQHRLVAAPIAGFHGQFEIIADQPFHFSSKYGTRIYLVPETVEEIPKFEKAVYAKWPSVLPPIGEIGSVPIWSPVKSALSTIELVSVEGVELDLKRVSHVEYDSSGNVVTDFQKRFWSVASWLIPILSILAGLFLCVVVYFRVRKTRPVASDE